MNALAANLDRFVIANTAGTVAAAVRTTVNGLNNNAKNNTRHYGWAGV